MGEPGALACVMGRGGVSTKDRAVRAQGLLDAKKRARMEKAEAEEEERLLELKKRGELTEKEKKERAHELGIKAARERHNRREARKWRSPSYVVISRLGAAAAWYDRASEALGDAFFGPTQDRACLRRLFAATGGPEGLWRDFDAMRTWRDDPRGPMGAWQGVELDARGSGRVTALRLSGKLRGGRLPRALGGLRRLSTLWLTQNELTGPIPATLGELRALVVLNLAGNKLEGHVPLRVLALHARDKTELRLAQAKPHGLRLPQNLGQLAHLGDPPESLVVRECSLIGEIPPSIADLNHLVTLDLSKNQLKGQVPKGLDQLWRLEELDLSSNQLIGPLDRGLATLSQLRVCRLHENRLDCQTKERVTVTFPSSRPASKAASAGGDARGGKGGGAAADDDPWGGCDVPDFFADMKRLRELRIANTGQYLNITKFRNHIRLRRQRASAENAVQQRPAVHAALDSTDK